MEQFRAVAKSCYRIAITLPGFRCCRCGHEWIPKVEGFEAYACPSCKSPYWRTPRKALSGSTTRAKRRQPKSDSG